MKIEYCIVIKKHNVINIVYTLGFIIVSIIINMMVVLITEI